jgi:hypothetical protein
VEWGVGDHADARLGLLDVRLRRGGARPPLGEVRVMEPYEHIARAEVLIAHHDALFDEEGRLVPVSLRRSPWDSAPVALELAKVHLDLAHMKMIGRMRA